MKERKTSLTLGRNKQPHNRGAAKRIPPRARETRARAKKKLDNATTISYLNNVAQTLNHRREQ